MEREISSGVWIIPRAEGCEREQLARIEGKSENIRLKDEVAEANGGAVGERGGDVVAAFRRGEFGAVVGGGADEWEAGGEGDQLVGAGEGGKHHRRVGGGGGGAGERESVEDDEEEQNVENAIHGGYWR